MPIQRTNLPYESVEDRSLFRSDELKKTHPLGKMPAAVIDGKPLFESSAICTLSPNKLSIDLIAKQGTWSRAQHDQWVCFNLSELEAGCGVALSTLSYCQSQKDLQSVSLKTKKCLRRELVIDEYLSDHNYFIENRFTVTDIIIGYTLNWARRKRLTEDFLSISAYLERLFAREHCVLPQD